jgi:DNA-binding response OmpR family regulator
MDGCRFDLGRAVARREAGEIHLTQREVGILRWLHDHRSRAVPRSELLEHVWGVPRDLQTRTVDMTISNLRQKIERDPSNPRIVITIKGTGYAWGTAPEA